MHELALWKSKCLGMIGADVNYYTIGELSWFTNSVVKNNPTTSWTFLLKGLTFVAQAIV